jgi:hypothetical protein
MNDRPANEPTEEVEVTPEMIEVGVRELSLSFNTDGVLDDHADVVRDVFQAMWRRATPHWHRTSRFSMATGNSSSGKIRKE